MPAARVDIQVKEGTGKMSFGPCDVVKVKANNEGGYVVMNATDYNPDKGHELFEGESAPDFVQEPHVTQAIADTNSAEASQAGVEAAAASGWGSPTEPPAVEPVAAPEAAPAPSEKPGKGK